MRLIRVRHRHHLFFYESSLREILFTSAQRAYHGMVRFDRIGLLNEGIGRENGRGMVETEQ